MPTIDTNNNDHRDTFNWLARHASPHFALGHAFFTDLIHDTAQLCEADDGEAFSWIVTKAGTHIAKEGTDHADALASADLGDAVYMRLIVSVTPYVRAITIG